MAPPQSALSGWARSGYIGGAKIGKIGSSNTLIFGAQVEQVDEHPFSSAAFTFELDDYPEAKALSLAELRALVQRGLKFHEVADLIGASEAFVRQTLNQRRYSHAKSKRQ